MNTQKKTTKKYNRSTDVQRTWREHGWKPTTEAQRKKSANFKDLMRL